MTDAKSFKILDPGGDTVLQPLAIVAAASSQGPNLIKLFNPD
jgi:hypothetical protein